jgi:hypothetical protein
VSNSRYRPRLAWIVTAEECGERWDTRVFADDAETAVERFYDLCVDEGPVAVAVTRPKDSWGRITKRFDREPNEVRQ